MSPCSHKCLARASFLPSYTPCALRATCHMQGSSLEDYLKAAVMLAYNYGTVGYPDLKTLIPCVCTPIHLSPNPSLSLPLHAATPSLSLPLHAATPSQSLPLHAATPSLSLPLHAATPSLTYISPSFVHSLILSKEFRVGGMYLTLPPCWSVSCPFLMAGQIWMKFLVFNKFLSDFSFLLHCQPTCPEVWGFPPPNSILSVDLPPLESIQGPVGRLSSFQTAVSMSIFGRLKKICSQDEKNIAAMAAEFKKAQGANRTSNWIGNLNYSI